MAADQAAESLPPKRTWSDPIARWLRTNPVVVAVADWVSDDLVPFLFALFVAAPIGLLILPAFVPKFVSNAIRRRRYGVTLMDTPLEGNEGGGENTPPPPRGDSPLASVFPDRRVDE